VASKKWERALVVLFESQSVIRIGTLLQESVGKRTLRVLGVLGVSAVNCFCAQIHRRGAEPAEITQRKIIFRNIPSARCNRSFVPTDNRLNGFLVSR
jgi:hypothetical protein